MAEACSGSELRGSVGVDLVDDDLTTVKKQNERNKSYEHGQFDDIQRSGKP